MCRKILILLIVFIMTAIIPAQAVNSEEQLKIKLNQKPLNLNPVYATNSTELMINRQIFDTLLKFNEEGELLPNLAESWEITNQGRKFIFNLEDNIYFHPYKVNGVEIPLAERKVKASDWKWTFEYLAAPETKSPHKSLLEKIDGYQEYQQGESDEIRGIKVIDDYQLEIELAESYSPFIFKMAKSPAVVLPAEVVLARQHKFGTAPVGTGPFILDEFSQDRITIIRNNNQDYQQQLPEDSLSIKKIEINFNSNNNFKNRVNEFDIYQLDPSINQEEVLVGENFDQFKLKRIRNNILYYAGINYNSSLMQNLDSKQLKNRVGSKLEDKKFLELIRKNDFIELERNKNSLVNNIYNKSYDLNSVQNQKFEINSISMLTNNTQLSVLIAGYIKNKFESHQISVQLEVQNWAEYLNTLKTREFESEIFLMSYEYENKFDFLADNFYSDSEKNYFNYQNQRLDNLIEYLKLTDNQEVSKQAYQIAEDILAADNPYLFIVQGVDNYLISNRYSDQKLIRKLLSSHNF